MRKLTQAEFLAKAQVAHGLGAYDYSLVVYRGKEEKVSIICPRHGVFEQRAAAHARGSGCPICFGKLSLGIDRFVQSARTIHGDKYDYSQTVYLPQPQKIAIRCPEHGVFSSTANNHLRGKGCKYCSSVAPLTQADFLTRARATHGDKYDYSRAVYTGVSSKVSIICLVHGAFKQAAGGHLAGRGCVKCADQKKAFEYPLTQSEFLARAQELHGDRYDYSQAVYSKGAKKVSIICREHGLFKQTASSHIRKGGAGGCRKCASRKLTELLQLTQQTFLAKARATHGDRYDYSQAVCKGSSNLLIIICRQHGAFEQFAGPHINQGSGCPICGLETRARALTYGQQDFLTRARATHGDKYDYSRAVYKKAIQHLSIICPQHGAFEQTATSHIQGSGCPSCAAERIADSNKLHWIERAAGRGCTLYLLRVFNHDEEFFKIGVTCRTIQHRYRQSALKGYQYEVLSQHTGTDAARIWDWEQSILETFAHLRYKPKIYFHGETECFSSADEILAIFPL